MSLKELILTIYLIWFNKIIIKKVITRNIKRFIVVYMASLKSISKKTW